MRTGILYSYIVNLYSQKIDANGEVESSENFDFQYSNNNLLQARKDAINMAKALDAQYSSDESYISPLAAQAKGYKDYSAYSLHIHIQRINEDDTIDDFYIYGDDDEALENLDWESNMLSTAGYIVDGFVHNGDEEDYVILNEDSDFLLE